MNASLKEMLVYLQFYLLKVTHCQTMYKSTLKLLQLFCPHQLAPKNLFQLSVFSLTRLSFTPWQNIWMNMTQAAKRVAGVHCCIYSVWV